MATVGELVGLGDRVEHQAYDMYRQDANEIIISSRQGQGTTRIVVLIIPVKGTTKSHTLSLSSRREDAPNFYHCVQLVHNTFGIISIQGQPYSYNHGGCLPCLPQARLH